MTFHDKPGKVSINLTVRRDTPLSSEESLWISRILASELNRPVDLSVETIPFIPLLLFEPGETELSEEIKKELLSIKEIYGRDENITVSIEAYPEESGKTGTILAEKRTESVAGFLTKDCGIPGNLISTTISSRRSRQPAIRITIENSQRPAAQNRRNPWGGNKF